MTEHHWFARVDDHTGNPQGAGFLVTPRHVVTCAHLLDVDEPAFVQFPTRPGSPTRPGGEPIPATQVYRGRSADDDGLDVAILEFPEPLAIEPARLAPLRALHRRQGQGLRVYGFPDDYERHGVTADVAATPYPRIGGDLLQVRPVDPAHEWLAHGFSGAAVFIVATGEVVGMVTHADPDTRQGLMLPIDRLYGCWSLGDLIALGPLSPTAYADLRDVLADQRHPHPRRLCYDVLGGRLTPELTDELSSVLDVAEWLATESMAGPLTKRGLVGDLVHEVMRDADPAARVRLRGWLSRHGEPAGRATTETRATDEDDVGPASVSVRVTPSATERDRYHVTMWLIRDIHDQADVGEQVLTEGPVPAAELPDVVLERFLDTTERVPEERSIIVEFFLPRDRLSDPVETWPLPPDGDTQLGWLYGVVVRDLKRSLEPPKRNHLARARRLGATLDWARCQHVRDKLRLAAWLAESPERAAVGLATDPVSPETLGRAIDMGVPVLLWSRVARAEHEDGEDLRACAGYPFRRDIDTGFSGARVDEWPLRLRKLRSQAALYDDPEHCGRAVTLLWDSPDRRPATIPLGFAE